MRRLLADVPPCCSRETTLDGRTGIVNYDVSPDGQRFLMLKLVEGSPPHLTVVQGLDRLMRERLPPAGR